METADLLLEFLKSGEGKTVIEKLEELNLKLQKCQALEESSKHYDMMACEKLKECKAVEHNTMLICSEIESEKISLMKMKEAFDAEKFASKQEKIYADATLKAANEKMAEADLKFKRAILEEERIKGLELAAIGLKQKWESVFKQIQKLTQDL